MKLEYEIIRKTNDEETIHFGIGIANTDKKVNYISDGTLSVSEFNNKISIEDSDNVDANISFDKSRILKLVKLLLQLDLELSANNLKELDS